MTRKLFYEDSQLCTFAARITARTEIKGRPAVILDQTAFYATSGGQPFDAGTLGGRAVLDVIETPQGIAHILDGPVESDTVRGEIDWDRRTDHMQQHHGQHILSAAFVETCGANTASFHLGAETCTIDLDKPVTAKEIEAAETLANRVVLENRTVSIGNHSREEAEKMKVRKIPDKVAGPLRIVSIPEFDAQPCSGTHPDATGRVGGITVLGTEKIRNTTRVTFVCGGRTVRTLSKFAKTLHAVGSKLSVPPDQTPDALDRRLEEERTLRRRLTDNQRRLNRYLGREVFDAAEDKLCTHEVENADMKGLKDLCQEILSHGEAIAVLVSASSKGTLFVAGASLDTDLRPAVKKLGVKGGGAPKLVQGSFPDTPPSEALKRFRDALS